MLSAKAFTFSPARGVCLLRPASDRVGSALSFNFAAGSNAARICRYRPATFTLCGPPPYPPPGGGGSGWGVEAIGESTIVLQRSLNDTDPFLVVIVHLRDSGKADLRGSAWLQLQKVQRWETVLTTEDPQYSPDPLPPLLLLLLLEPPQAARSAAPRVAAPVVASTRLRPNR